MGGIKEQNTNIGEQRASFGYNDPQMLMIWNQKF